MFNSNIMIQLLSILATILLMCGIHSTKTQSVEKFVNVPRRVVADPIVRTSSGMLSSARNTNVQNLQYSKALTRASRNQAELAIKRAVDPSGFVSVANYQQNMVSKFSPYGLTTYTRYKMPPQNMLGTTPTDPTPLDYTRMVKENYSEPAMQPKQSPEYLSAEDLMPSQTMETVGADGQVTDTFQAERLIYANTKSVTQSAGDAIRGDLAVIPLQKTGWFESSYANPVNLRTGALAAMGGVNNESAKELSTLISAYSGSAPVAFAGSPVTGTTMKELGVGPHRESLSVSAFP